MRLTFSLIGINIFIFVLQVFGLINNGLAFTPALFMDKPYTLLTSMFMHGSINHLLLNMFGLFIFGSIVEHEIGSKKYLILYFFAGLLGSLGYMLFNDSPFIPALGASGAIFGLIGGAAVLKPKQIIWTPYGPLPMIVAAFFWGAAEFVGFFGVDTVAQSAHLFGILGGIIVALLLLAGLKWQYASLLIAVPIIFTVFLSGTIPTEIQSYEIPLNCTSIGLYDEIALKVGVNHCGESLITTMTSPSRDKFNLAKYNQTLPLLTEEIYTLVFKEECKAQQLSIDVVNDTAIVKGKICDKNYVAYAGICDKVEVNLIEFFEENPKIDGINCTFLQ